VFYSLCCLNLALGGKENRKIKTQQSTFCKLVGVQETQHHWNKVLQLPTKTPNRATRAAFGSDASCTISQTPSSFLNKGIKGLLLGIKEIKGRVASGSNS
jgi:hypothetical protein